MAYGLPLARLVLPNPLATVVTLPKLERIRTIQSQSNTNMSSGKAEQYQAAYKRTFVFIACQQKALAFPACLAEW